MTPHPLEKFGYGLCIYCRCVRPLSLLEPTRQRVCLDAAWCFAQAKLGSPPARPKARKENR